MKAGWLLMFERAVQGLQSLYELYEQQPMLAFSKPRNVR